LLLTNKHSFKQLVKHVIDEILATGKMIGLGSRTVVEKALGFAERYGQNYSFGGWSCFVRLFHPERINQYAIDISPVLQSGNHSFQVNWNLEPLDQALWSRNIGLVLLMIHTKCKSGEFSG
jgi:hypothetical protein